MPINYIVYDPEGSIFWGFGSTKERAWIDAKATAKSQSAIIYKKDCVIVEVPWTLKEISYRLSRSDIMYDDESQEMYFISERTEELDKKKSDLYQQALLCRNIPVSEFDNLPLHDKLNIIFRIVRK